MRRALVFAHFDPHAVVDDYVLHALTCYRQYFEVIHFVTTAPLNTEQLNRATMIVDRVIVRGNVGYDFMSWRVGFESLAGFRMFDEIVFANDSCYGPCTDMSAFWPRVVSLEADLWGASLNRQFQPHVQSFFMGFGHRLIQSGFARDFWHTIEVISNKQDLIMTYEIGLSAYVEREGYRIGGVVDLGEINDHTKLRIIADNASTTDRIPAKAARTYIEKEQFLNPVQLGWGEALRQGLPFIKVELFRDNPGKVNVHSLFETVRVSTWYDVSMIARHVERTARAGALPPRIYTNSPLRRGFQAN